ncbi:MULTISPECIES: HEPN domain-containing protein [Leptospira]|uniref:RiboL-PSP-HEPN domain-containing protein n=1 Tax=Leptospira weilii str. UI 13098 TaxID=1088542 RepID=M6Q5N5_9LEPT|nr:MULTISPECIES: HEPN domain-containing protein [Leptospira]EMN90594.1 hypothetical protein LEP1GSC108_3364 [Leptospira weilii str. UI 13098]
MSSIEDIIELLQKDFNDINSILEKEGEISLSANYKSIFTKTLVMTIATAFEEKVKDLIHSAFNTSENIMLKEFINNKGLKRQYHTLFNWENKNANSFFSLFGQDFKKFMEDKVKENKEFDSSIVSFLEIGNQRNKLAHLNFYLTSIELTPNEVINHFQKANVFISTLRKYSEEFLSLREKNVA